MLEEEVLRLRRLLISQRLLGLLPYTWSSSCVSPRLSVKWLLWSIFLLTAMASGIYACIMEFLLDYMSDTIAGRALGYCAIALPLLIVTVQFAVLVKSEKMARLFIALSRDMDFDHLQDAVSQAVPPPPALGHRMKGSENREAHEDSSVLTSSLNKLEKNICNIMAISELSSKCFSLPVASISLYGVILATTASFALLNGILKGGGIIPSCAFPLLYVIFTCEIGQRFTDKSEIWRNWHDQYFGLGLPLLFGSGFGCSYDKSSRLDPHSSPTPLHVRLVHPRLQLTAAGGATTAGSADLAALPRTPPYTLTSASSSPQLDVKWLMWSIFILFFNTCTSLVILRRFDIEDLFETSSDHFFSSISLMLFGATFGVAVFSYMLFSNSQPISLPGIVSAFSLAFLFFLFTQGQQFINKVSYLISCLAPLQRFDMCGWYHLNYNALLQVNLTPLLF
ncbi:hypothetical protein C7M84_022721 [Penaeus vannamei]|uniref:Uncharacterized protein n=1 Tax=Penaeus vannamei TaxID=6689 RepID=A0A423U5V6_PENVA|nr:hypothetical protein C7M84_022721 [Penaeus vannamei]